MKSLILVITLILPLSMFAQDYGYFGKKNIIAINGLGNMPLIYLFANNGSIAYKANSNGKLTEKNNLFDYGMNVSISHAFSGKFALGFEYALNFSKCNGPNQGVVFYDINNSGYPTYDYVYMKHEQLDLRTMLFMPKIEYSLLGAQLPFGINNQFGIGFATTTVLDKKYSAEIDPSYYSNSDVAAAFAPSKVLNKNRSAINGLTIMYGFNVRTPISKRILINYGIRYTLNTTFNFEKVLGSNAPSSNYYVTDSELKSLVGRKRLTSILSFNIGINYVF